MEELLVNEISVGDKVTGNVIDVKDNCIMVDLHQFTEGTMYINEYDPKLQSFSGVVKLGDEVSAIVKSVDNERGKIFLSRIPLLVEAQNEVMKDLNKEHKVIKVKIDKNIGFGLVGKYLGNEVFVPSREIDLDKEFNADSLVGQTIEVRLKEFDDRRRRYVASRRELLAEARNQERQNELDSINLNDELEGVVSKIDEHVGVFVRFKFNQGLIRYRELSHTPFNKMEDVVKVGDKVKVLVIGKDGNKIDLSRKALIETPYSVFASKHKVSDVVTGKVVQKLPIGAIVELAPFVTALLHKNEISWNPNDNSFDYLKLNSEVKAQIISIDAKKQRIGLSLKSMEDNPWAKVKGNVGDVLEVEVIEILSGKGLKVACLGVEGFIPLHEVVMKEKSSKLEDYYSVGDKVTAEITAINPKFWRLELSIRRYQNKLERKQFDEYTKKEQEKEVTITLGDLYKDILK